MYWTNRTTSFAPGAQAQFETVLTANHLGYIQFTICKISSSGLPDVTESCLGQNYLKLAGQATEWRTFVKAGIMTYTPTLQLPASTGRYVVRMHYVTGNSCIDPATVPIVGNPTSLPLCGSAAYPEEFWNCADIVIGGGAGTPVTAGSLSSSVVPASSTVKSSVVPASSTAKSSVKTISTTMRSTTKTTARTTTARSTTKTTAKSSSTKSSTQTGTVCVFGAYRCNGQTLQQCTASSTWADLGTCAGTCFDGKSGPFVGCN
jgi:hypothetical protein